MSTTSLEDQIRRLRKRVRLLLIERYGLFGGGAGAAVASCMVILSTKVTTLLDYRIWVGTVMLGALGGAAFALTRRLEDLTIAIAADRRTGLKERLSTAVALSDAPGDFERALVSDANEHVAGLRSSEVFRRRFGRPHIAFLGAAVLLIGVIFLPQIANSPNRRAEVAVMQQEGASIQKVGKEIERQSAGDRQRELKKLAGKLQELGRRMQTGRLPKKEAMIQVQRLNKQIKAEQNRLAKENSNTKSMAEARAEMKRASQELAQKMADRMAEKENIPPSEALNKMASDKRMAELARKSEPLTQAEQKELEKAVEKYANPGSSLAIPKEIGEALAKLAENEDFKKASELMQKLALKAQSGSMSELDREALQQQFDALAKALQNTDLDKLAKMMRENAEKLARMSPEELAKMAAEMQKMQQLAKALEQAGGT